MGIPFETRLNFISREIAFANILRWNLGFCMVFREVQHHCCILCAIFKEFGNINRYFETVRFQETWVWHAFLTAILFYISLENYSAQLPYDETIHSGAICENNKCIVNGIQSILTQTQAKLIKLKQLQVSYQVCITFINIQIIIRPWYINDHEYVGRPPLRYIWTLTWRPPDKERHARQ